MIREYANIFLNQLTQCGGQTIRREPRLGHAWHEDYTQTETRITGHCRPVPLGYRRGGIDYLRLFLDWLWPWEDGLRLCDFDHVGFAAGQL